MSTSTIVTRRPRRSEQEWRAVMAQFARSGLGSEAFCAREGIAPSTFWNWRSRLQRGGRAKAAAPGSASPFVELVSDSASRAFDIELDLGRGVVLRMRGR